MTAVSNTEDSRYEDEMRALQFDEAELRNFKFPSKYVFLDSLAAIQS